MKSFHLRCLLFGLSIFLVNLVALPSVGPARELEYFNPQKLVETGWLKENLTDDDDKVFLPSNELRTLYEEAGIMADKEIVTHCQTGIRAAHSYFTLRLLGYTKVRLYDGSWAEWGNDPETPIVSDKPPR